MISSSSTKQDESFHLALAKLDGNQQLTIALLNDTLQQCKNSEIIIKMGADHADLLKQAALQLDGLTTLLKQQQHRKSNDLSEARSQRMTDALAKNGISMKDKVNKDTSSTQSIVEKCVAEVSEQQQQLVWGNLDLKSAIKDLPKEIVDSLN